MSPLRRRLLFGALYFSEGAPIGWLWWALPSQLRRAGVEVDAITALTAALAIPWALKFVWAPLVDVLQSRWFGLRGWLVTAQLGMACTLVPMLTLDPVEHWQSVFGLLLAHAFCAATQDVAIDALAIRTVPAAERGAIVGAMQVGMIGGRVLFSSGVLWLQERTSVLVAVPALLGVLSVTLAFVAFTPNVSGGEVHVRRVIPEGRRWRYARALVGSPRFWRLVAFALLGGAGFEAAGSLSGSWLVDHGVSPDGVAAFRLVSAGAMAAGAWACGRWTDRVGAARAARSSLVAVVAFVALAAISGSVAVYVAVYFGIGAFTAASYALFMHNAAGPLAATVFSAFMGLTNACEAWAAWSGGKLQVAYGYGAAMLVLAASSLLALPLLRGRLAR